MHYTTQNYEMDGLKVVLTLNFVLYLPVVNLAVSFWYHGIHYASVVPEPLIYEVSRLRVVPPFWRSPSRESKETNKQTKKTVKEIDLSAPHGNQGVRRSALTSMFFTFFFFFDARDRLRRKAGTARSLKGQKKSFQRRNGVIDGFTSPSPWK